MHQRKGKKFIIYFFILVIVSSIGNKNVNNLKFSKIKNINIFGLEEKNNKNFFNQVKNLNLENIFFLNKNEILKLINSNSLIERYTVFKEYPSTINIDIDRTNFLAKINDNGKIFLIGSNKKLTYVDYSYSELPFIFGKPNIKEFFKFKKIIDESKFSYNQIKTMYFFPSKRWDIKLKENILLKLPETLTTEKINYLHEFLENYSRENLTIIDARIENNIILNE